MGPTGRGRWGRGRTLTRPAGPPTGRHAGGHRPATALATPTRAECGHLRPAPRPNALLPAPEPWACRRLLQHPLPKDLSAGNRQGWLCPLGSLSFSGQRSDGSRLSAKGSWCPPLPWRLGKGSLGAGASFGGQRPQTGGRGTCGRAVYQIYINLSFLGIKPPGPQLRVGDGGGYLCIKIRQNNI